MPPARQLSCDVLVLGGGGAGLRAAIAARETGAQVLTVEKGWTGHSGATAMAVGAMAAVDPAWMAAGDSTALHLADTLRGGGFLNDPVLAASVVQGAADAVREMAQMGVWFDRDQESGELLLLRPDGGHSKNRALSSGRRIGLELLQVLRAEALRLGVRFLDNVFAAELLSREDGAVGGLLGLDTRSPALIEIRAKAVVLATGGLCGLYTNTDVPRDLTGDGMGLALAAGAELADMEFVQFHPLGLLAPEAVRGRLGTHLSVVHLLDRSGERFLARYDPQRMEQTTRDVISRAIAAEVRAGRGSPRGGVYGSMRHLERRVLEEKVPEYCRLYRQIGFDPAADLLELAPTAHYTMGGVFVNEQWACTAEGLYAAGEVCAGVHGANRLSQNALTEMLVSGRIAGENAADYARSRAFGAPIPAETAALLSQAEDTDAGETPSLWRRELRRIVSEGAGVLRDREGLAQAEQALTELAARPMRRPADRKSGAAWTMLLENRLMLRAARCLVCAASLRQESRGSHQRLDFPTQDDENYRCRFALRQAGDGFAVRRIPVREEARPDVY